MELKEKLAKLKARKRELESLLRNSSQRSSGYGSDWDYGYGSGWDYGYGPYGYDLFGSYDDWDEEDEEDEEEKMRKLKLGFGVWPGGNHGSESGEPSEVAGASEDSGAVNGGNFSDLVNGAFGGGKQGASIEAAPAPESETQAAKDDWDDLFNRSSQTGKIFDDYSLGTSDIDQAADEPESPTEEPASGSFDDLVKGAFGGGMQGASIEAAPDPESETQAAKDDWDDLFNRSSRNGKIFDDYSLGTSDIDQAADTGETPENTANDPDDNWLDKIFGGRGKILGGSVETVDKGTDKRQNPPGVLSSGTEGLLASTNDDYMLGDSPSATSWSGAGKPENRKNKKSYPDLVTQAYDFFKQNNFPELATTLKRYMDKNKILLRTTNNSAEHFQPLDVIFLNKANFGTNSDNASLQKVTPLRRFGSFFDLVLALGHELQHATDAQQKPIYYAIDRRNDEASAFSTEAQLIAKFYQLYPQYRNEIKNAWNALRTSMNKENTDFHLNPPLQYPFSPDLEK